MLGCVSASVSLLGCLSASSWATASISNAGSSTKLMSSPVRSPKRIWPTNAQATINSRSQPFSDGVKPNWSRAV